MNLDVSVAVRDIEVGEELTVSYLYPDVLCKCNPLSRLYCPEKQPALDKTKENQS